MEATSDRSEKSDEVVADRALLEDLFSSLYNGRIIYHERITILSEVVKYEITDSEFSLCHRPIKLLSADPVFSGMYEHWESLSQLECGVNIGNADHPYRYAGGRLSMAYASMKIWPGYELVERVSNLSDDELRTDFWAYHVGKTQACLVISRRASPFYLRKSSAFFR